MTGTNGRGRPRRPDVEEHVLDATVELLGERGIEGTTMSAVIERSGIARATVYLRWPNRRALIVAAIRHAMGRPVMVTTGNLAADLQLGVDQAGAILSTPSFHGIFPAVVAALFSPVPGTDAAFTFDEIAPGAAAIAAEYHDLAAAQGFRSDVLPDVVVDLIVGSQLGHLLINGQGPDATARAQLLDVVTRGLAASPAASEPGATEPAATAGRRAQN